MKVLEIISPVLVMIILGILCRKWKLLNKNGIDSMKALVTNIMLPVAIFHALATSDYGAETAKLVGIMFIMFWHRISYEAAYDRKLPQVSAIYGQCV